MFFGVRPHRVYHRCKVGANEQNVGFDVRRPSHNVDFFRDLNTTKFVVFVGKFGGRHASVYFLLLFLPIKK
jgi:hypothetical protein